MPGLRVLVDSCKEQCRPTAEAQSTRQIAFDDEIDVRQSIYTFSNTCLIGFIILQSAMSYDLSMEVDPYPSTPSGAPASALSDEIVHDEFDNSQLSQSSRVITIPDDGSDRTRTDLVISKIEDIFAAMVDVLAEGGDALIIPYRRRASQREGGVLRFPGSTVQEAIKFSQLPLFLASGAIVLTVPPFQPE